MKKKRVFKVIIVFIFLVIFIYGYFILIKKTDFNDFLAYSIKNKYSFKDESVVDKVVYRSLNRLVQFNDNIIKNDIITSEEIIFDGIPEEKIITDKKPVIYIYNTHDTEKYSLGFAYDYSIRPTVKIASYILKDHLNDLGIASFIQTGNITDYLKKHNLDYKGSYEASRYYIKEDAKKGDFKIYIDIHRDSVKQDKTLYKKDGKRYAKVLFVLAKKHKNYKNNLEFINYINSKINENYSGLSRGVLERNDAVFNQDISSRAILLELGGVDNTLEEINNTLLIISSILNEYIIKEGLNG